MNPLSKPADLTFKCNLVSKEDKHNCGTYNKENGLLTDNGQPHLQNHAFPQESSSSLPVGLLHGDHKKALMCFCCLCHWHFSVWVSQVQLKKVGVEASWERVVASGWGLRDWGGESKHQPGQEEGQAHLVEPRQVSEHSGRNSRSKLRPMLAPT